MGEYDETAAGETSVSEVSVPLAFWRIQSRDARFATSSAFVFRDEVAQGFMNCSMAIFEK